MAVWVATLREPVRGAMDGVASPSSPTPLRSFVSDLSSIVPPFTLLGAWQRGPTALASNLGVAALAALGMPGKHLPPDHDLGDANTIGGYMAVHARPAAFEGRDGMS